ncbi:probable 2-oxoglutarate dehydrogenase E1 component [Coccomyxa sp. Obi]|nr:probable 2-oxoglutarate dehydrogenase E1 component [Coccomyxa sp. Obi]
MCGAHLTKTLRPLAQRGHIGNKLRLNSTSAHLGEVGDTLRLVQVLQAYRSHGHLHASLDPLERLRGPWFTECQNWTPPRNAMLERLGQLDRTLSTNKKAAWLAAQLGMELPTTSSRKFFVGGALTAGEPLSLDTWSLPAVIEHMQDAYCGTLTAELDHLASQEEQRWLAERVERREPISAGQRVRILRMLVHADEFERFLALHFPKSKRFGVEGCEALLPGVDALVGRCAAAGVRRIEVGMAHRGRLSLLCNLLHKPPGALFAQMENGQSDYRVGDVKYHLGDTATLAFGKGADRQEIRVSIAPNPSHLEAVNPVVMGLVRAVQTRLGSGGRTAVAGLLIHGDAAFAGLGIVAECLQLSNTPGFTVGGMLHIVVNNQVGFTTAPREGRSSVHATDMAKAVGAPVLHANADDPEAVVAACRIAADWRARWRKDVVVDLVGYRRHGHNELDDPQATLPLTYERIQEHPRVLDIYAARLSAQGLIPASVLDSLKAEVQAKFEEEFASYEAGLYREQPRDWLATSWQGDALQAMASEPSIRQAPELKQEPTGLPLPTLQWVGRSICHAPADFSRHPDVERLCQGRLSMVENKNSRVDFGMAEALAFGTLALHRGVRPPGTSAGGLDSHDWQPSTLDSQLQQEELIGKDADASAGLNLGAYAVRLSGQDVERGTFNHRHAVQYDCRTAKRRVALDEIQPGMQECVEVWNSPLSEAGVLGFEYGYSLGNERRGLTAFEAQFGDFVNNAQCIIDQFISAGEERWGQTSGLVLQLPHGFEGQGPDHSSARMERFLQLANDDADHLPGNSPAQLREISATFAALAKEYGGQLNREQIVEVLRGAGVGEGGELAELLWTEMGLSEDAHITQAAWEGFMVQYSRRFAERQANLFVVCATTPAQLFHALRRQMNRPFVKPLVLLTPKYLLHHRPATSALADFTVGTFFNRVIDDGKASDNTRHKAVNPATGEPFLLPPDQIRRVILCCGQIYYNLSLARRARRIRDTVLVRLEQITPFPSDLLFKVITQYGNAEVVWCQEEPKNMGAYFYIKPRLATAMRDLGPPASAPPRPLRYVGRTASASVATASIAIHRIETKHIIDSALSPGPIEEDVKI